MSHIKNATNVDVAEGLLNWQKCDFPNSPILDNN